MAELTLVVPGPHNGQPVRQAGQPLETARAAMIMAHGRGSSSWDILQLTDHLDDASFAFLAPQAAGNAWYPNRFMTPAASNQPWLGSALAGLGYLVELAGLAGIPPGRVIMLGFSQGACLSLEYAARSGAPLGGVAGLSGGLIGAPDELSGYSGSLAGMPALLACSEVDPHIPKERVLESAKIFQRLGAQVDMRLYADLGHTVNIDELQAVQALMDKILESD